MREFFHGWQRKMGAATLVMALTFMSGWARSQSRDDFVMIPCGKETLLMESRSGEIEFSRVRTLGVGEFHYDLRLGPRMVLIAVPYWLIVLPLTLLSAYLLIIEPRPKQNHSGDTPNLQRISD